MSTFVSMIFAPEPDQWGLRGDPFFWRYLKAQYQTVPLPYSPKVFQKEVLHIFTELTGKPPAPDKHYFVEQFAERHVGMSTGYLSGDFWLQKAMPLLMKRLEQANQSKMCMM
ncbi:hypothetical protein [Anaerotignum sp.]|uniref:hypothetical protein n=1 Tax=Anaerotignum sp. TaxID=2039241 RepID=UPI003736EC7E